MVMKTCRPDSDYCSGNGGCDVIIWALMILMTLFKPAKNV